MVKVCPYNYPKSQEEEYIKYYNKYPYELHDFQKWAIQSIVTGNHVLVACPTGSGKTLPAEFAIDYFYEKGKKIIYTSPIKALSNEKFYAFTHKYPHISIGLITGDIKTNPDADVLIMTTEILLNKLYQIKSTIPNVSSAVSFDMDIESELGCVVFDEIHMINDESRGHVWEQCIMLLPSHIQITGLSATLDNPEKFAYWLETKGDISKPIEKEVYLTRKQKRAVPLIHYNYITVTNSIYKIIKDKAAQSEIKSLTNKPFIIQDADGKFNNDTYQNTKKMIKLFEKNNVRIKRQFVLNNLAEYLVNKNMLPALCYVFSRKQLEICAKEMTTNLLEFDSKVPYIMDRECEQIIRKLPNYQEYLNLPEYINTLKLLRKGVGIHHAGMMPILREMTELLFAKGYIKILFCTETMSVGINLPVKTTIFTDINKFNGEEHRMLYSHEYTQAAGRAGRLGLDSVGHVIHLNNLFRDVNLVDYKTMMNGKPQELTSKFKISYNLILNLLDIGDNNLIQFASKSMITGDLEQQMGEIYKKIQSLQDEINQAHTFLDKLNTPIDIILEFIELLKNRPGAINKRRKEIDKNLSKIQNTYKNIVNDKNYYERYSPLQKQRELDILQKQYNSLDSYFKSGVGDVMQLLYDQKFVEGDIQTMREETFKLTMLGKIASQIRETHCLVFTNLYNDKKLDCLTTKQLICLFSCFTNLKVLDEFKDNFPKSNYTKLNELMIEIVEMYNRYKDLELQRNINTGFDYDLQFDLLKYVDRWCDCENADDCEVILQEMGAKKGIFLGEFVKALLKINNISCEMEKIAEMTGNIEFLSKLKDIPNMTLKYVVTNQSLYV